MAYWQRAGQRAIERSAHVEAIAHLTKGLELLKTLPDTPERIQHELALHISLGIALIATKGLCGPGSRTSLCPSARAVSAAGETPQLFPVLCGLVGILSPAGGVPYSAGAGGAVPQLWPRVPKIPRSSCEAHCAPGRSFVLLGELAPARAHLEQGIALYDPSSTVP